MSFRIPVGSLFVGVFLMWLLGPNPLEWGGGVPDSVLESQTPTVVSFHAPAFDEPARESARQASLFTSVRLQFQRCESLHFLEDRDLRREARENFSGFIQRNESRVNAHYNRQYTQDVYGPDDLAEELEDKGDGFWGSLQKFRIMRKRQPEMVEGIATMIGGQQMRIDFGLSETPTYSECFQFMRKIGYGTYDLTRI